ncbi:MAG: lipase maturation factor family protein [Polyangiales bacterium]
MSTARPRSTYGISSWLFGRSLGAVLLVAFISLGVQAQGLFGDAGVMPIAGLVAQAKSAGHSFWQHPSAFWWGSGDSMIGAIWISGAAAAAALLLGFVPKLATAVAWFCYLSFVSVGWPFMSFQWDTLLLEVTFTAFFFVPLRAWDRPLGHSTPNRVARWALWWLLFRLVFRSAWVKLASGDATWADLSALSYHYWTQPLPTVFGWYANLLPDWFQSASCALMFAIEFAAPLLILLPWAWARRSSAASIAGLMLLVAFTGNYGFFNLLAIVLCLPLLDDALLARLFSGRFDPAPRPERKTRWNALPGVAPALVIAVSGAIFVAGTFAGGVPRWLRPVYPFNTLNNYGLFAVMTTERPEIEIEGTLDGKTWETYEFRYKPGPLDRAPRWAAPHQPRLDWQMWFAALGDYRRNPWLGNLVTRLLEGEPSVLRLIETNPFEGEPPKQVRAVVYRYEMTDREERAATGNWWRRSDRARYSPTLGVPIESTSTEE